MEWEKLLCEERCRKLLGGKDSYHDPADRRTEFDRDLDRAIFSTPVKRLQDKAQVFPLEPNDSVRTRLTHSLEVSAVARGFAGDVAQWLAEQGHLGKTPERSIRAIEAIAATCGLIHDLGNPPFGHSGEDSIREWFKKNQKLLQFGKAKHSKQLRQDFLKFDGNAQTLRLVSKLQILSDEYGLNLTAGTFSAACKYLAASHLANGKSKNSGKKKTGFFASERDVVDAVRRNAGTGNARNPITFLVEAADDAVYATVDLEDGVKKGVLHWHMIDKRLSGAATEDEAGLIRECLKRADSQISSGVQNRWLTGKAEDEARAQAFRVAAILCIKRAVVQTFSDHYREIIQGRYLGELVADGEARVLVEACKSLGRDFVYRSEETLRLELQGRRVISDLMDIFWEAADKGKDGGWGFPDKGYALLSKNYKTICQLELKQKQFPERYCKLRLVTDYVCGMTDTFACSLHKQLTNG